MPWLVDALWELMPHQVRVDAAPGTRRDNVRGCCTYLVYVIQSTVYMLQGTVPGNSLLVQLVRFTWHIYVRYIQFLYSILINLHEFDN